MDDQDRLFRRALAATLRAERAASKRTREEVAEYIGASESTVKRHEAGTIDPHGFQIDKYAQLYGITGPELFARVDQRKRSMMGNSG